MFNAVSYIETLHGQLNATKNDYTFALVSSVSALEELLEKSRRVKKFLAVADSNDGNTFRGAGGAYFERRTYTIFVIQRAQYGDMDARATILAQARSIFRNIVSRIIRDRYSIPVIDLSRVQFYEVPPSFATGTCGIYFIITVENPVDLTYDESAWT